MNNKEFGKLVARLITTYRKQGMSEDEAVALAFKEAKIQAHDGTVMRVTRAQGYIYWKDGEPTIEYKEKEDLKAAVERLNGRVIPTYDDHDGSTNLSNCTGIVYNVMYDETTGSIYGEVYPPHPKGTQNSPGFYCAVIETEDGRKIQTEIDLDHVAVSENLRARGGKTVAVIDEMDVEELQAENEKLKAEIEELKAELEELRGEVDSYVKKERDSLVSAITSTLKEDSAVDLSNISIEGLRKMVEVVKNVDSKVEFFEKDEEEKYIHKGNVM